VKTGELMNALSPVVFHGIDFRRPTMLVCASRTPLKNKRLLARLALAVTGPRCCSSPRETPASWIPAKHRCLCRPEQPRDLLPSFRPALSVGVVIVGAQEGCDHACNLLTARIEEHRRYDVLSPGLAR
jgi:hypothetical protein